MGKNVFLLFLEELYLQGLNCVHPAHKTPSPRRVHRQLASGRDSQAANSPSAWTSPARAKMRTKQITLRARGTGVKPSWQSPQNDIIYHANRTTQQQTTDAHARAVRTCVPDTDQQKQRKPHEQQFQELRFHSDKRGRKICHAVTCIHTRTKTNYSYRQISADD